MSKNNLEAELEKARLKNDKNEVEVLILEVNQLFERDEQAISGTCFSLANQLSEILFEEDMKILFANKIQWRNYMFRMAAYGIVSINDLLYTSYIEPDTMHLLKIPKNLIDRLKEEFCLLWELINVSKSKLSKELTQFCLPIKNLNELRRLPWRVVNSRLLATKASPNDVWFLRRAWNQESELRKTLSEFPGGMVDEAESMGIKKVSDFTAELSSRFTQTYDLPLHQKELLNRLGKIKATSTIQEMFSSVQSSVASLRGNIERANKLLKEVEQDTIFEKNDPSQSQKELLDSLEAVGLNLNIRESRAADGTFLLLRDNLRRAQEFLEYPSKPYDNDQDLISSVSERAALNAFHFGTNRDAVLSLAVRQLFNCPGSCSFSKHTPTQTSRTVCFKTSNEAICFRKLATEIGIEAAFVIQEKMKPTNRETESRCQNIVMTYFQCFPVFSFRLENHDLKLTSDAKDSLMGVDSVVAAKKFLKEYGTHIPTGIQSIGGMMSYFVEVVLPVKDSIAKLQDFANKQLQHAISHFKFTPTGNAELIDYVTDGGEIVSAQCTYSFCNRGPLVAHPSLFEKLVKVSFRSWHLIERVDPSRLSSSLSPVWEWVKSQEPDTLKQAEYLRMAWIQLASRCVSYEGIIKQELLSIQEEGLDYSRVDFKEKIETNTKQLANLFDKEDELLISLQEIFKNLHALKDIANEDDPVVKYLNNQSFRQLLLQISAMGKDKRNSKVIQFLRQVLDASVVGLLESKGCILEEPIKRMLGQPVCDNDVTELFSEKLANVKLSNLIEYLSLEISSAKLTVKVDDVKWLIESMLGAVLRRENPSGEVYNNIYQTLIKKYAWSENAFKFPLTLDAYSNMIEDLKNCYKTKQNYGESEENAGESCQNDKNKGNLEETVCEATEPFLVRIPPAQKPPVPPKPTNVTSPKSLKLLCPRPFLMSTGKDSNVTTKVYAPQASNETLDQRPTDSSEIKSTSHSDISKKVDPISTGSNTPTIPPLITAPSMSLKPALPNDPPVSSNMKLKIEKLYNSAQKGIQAHLNTSDCHLMDTFFQNYPGNVSGTKREILTCAGRNECSGKKTYFDFLIDRPSDLAKKSFDLEMVHRLRHRMKLSFKNSNSEDYNGESIASILMAAEPKSNSNETPSSYDTMLKVLSEYDASAICEIFCFLLESKFAVPLFNPLTGECYTKLLRHVKVQLPNIKLPISLGNDVGLGRVAVVSFRDATESQAPELIKSLFNVESFHGYDFTRDSATCHPLVIDIGLGCIARKPQIGGLVNQPLVDYVLVALITGKFDLCLSFVREFADYLLVEDSPSEGFTTSFYQWMKKKEEPANLVFSSKTQVMLWKPTSGKLQHSAPKQNFENHGFYHTSVCGPLGDKLVDLMAATVRYTIEPQTLQQSSPWNERKSLRKLQLIENYNAREELVPFDIDKLLESGVKNLTEARKSFFLQFNFRDQAIHEEAVREHRLDEQKRQEAEKKVDECLEQRKAFGAKCNPNKLLEFFVEQLNLSDQETRVLTIRQLEKSLEYRSDFELAGIQQQIDHYYALSINVKHTTTDESFSNKQLFIAAKREYRESMLHIEHLWRELGHLFVACPRKYNKLPKLAAQHLMDGFSLELLDGDANLINLEWVRAVFLELGTIIDRQRIFVLSVIGVQSSGKSTLLNTMFGIKMRTSVGQCTRGINMQLVPVEGRQEYDYILILDTEGTRSPDFYGTPLSEKRDNQMATLSILLADATIIVNPGENDAATKEILPIVLMAYQGSKLAEDNGGRLSSMMFFVYNRIDTTQKDKLTNIIQTLANSLVEAFDAVKKMGGFSSPLPNVQTQGNCLFRNFKLDASNSSESDVRILGQSKLSFVPPKDVPDPAYGEALVEFREHIHRRVTETEGHPWQSRSLGDLSEYIDQIWQCICSTDFNLQFATVIERSNFDQLDAEYRKCETKFATACVVEYNKLRQVMIKEMDAISEQGSVTDVTYEAPIEDEIYSPLVYDEPSSWYVTASQLKSIPLNEKINDAKSMQVKFSEGMQSIIKQLDEEVMDVLYRRGREKWRSSYEQIWDVFKMKKIRHWRRQIKYSYDTIFKYDYLFEKFQKDTRKRIERMFQDKQRPDSEEELRELFEKLFEENLKKAKRDYPAIDVKARIYQCYSQSPVIKQSTIDLSDELIETQCVKLFMGHIETRPSSRYEEEQSKTMQILQGLLKSRPLEAAQRLDDCLYRIYEHAKSLKSQIECYDDSVVIDTIQQTDIFLRESDVAFEYTERKLAHFYARHALVFYMRLVQCQWDANNSLEAKFNEKSNKEAMWQFFMMTAQGEEKVKLFSLLVRKTFTQANLIEAFRERIGARVVELVKKQTWLYDFRWMQCYVDLYLVQLLDRNEVSRVLELATNPLDLYNEVLGKLLQVIATDLIKSGKEWDKFVHILKSFVSNAHDEASSSQKDKARCYLESLRTSLRNVLKNETLSQRLFICSGEEYIALDKDSSEDFELYCKEEVLKCIDESLGPQTADEFVVAVSQTALHTLRQENVSGILWRCQAYCPLCKSMCMKEFGHDPYKVQHDTIHQPAGIAGVRSKDQLSLSSQSCSQHAKKSFFLGFFRDDKSNLNLKEWNSMFPMWANPKTGEEWPLREYIFYKYNRELAELYGLKVCKKMPQRYKRDFSAIRHKLTMIYRGSLL